MQYSHPGQLLLDHPKVVNFLPELGAISSMIHLEDGTYFPLWFSRVHTGERLGWDGLGGLGFGHRQEKFNLGWMET